jgi:hypothetical protein
MHHLNLNIPMAGYASDDSGRDHAMKLQDALCHPTKKPLTKLNQFRMLIASIAQFVPCQIKILGLTFSLVASEDENVRYTGGNPWNALIFARFS